MRTNSPRPLDAEALKSDVKIDRLLDSLPLPERQVLDEPVDVMRGSAHSDGLFVSALVGAYAGSVPARPVLPEGLREGVIALLAGLMADPERLDAYAEALAAELERRGLRAALLRSGGAGLDLPGDRIAADGFAGLPDGLLADIALSPEAIAVLGDHLHEPATRRGGWFVDAVLEAHASRAEDRARESDPRLPRKELED
jgi:hypothetical protein